MISKFRFLFVFIFILTCTFGFSQKQIINEKSTFRDSLNRFYIQTTLPLYFFVSTKPDGEDPEELSQNNSDKQFNKVDPIKLDGNGIHHIQHFDAHEQRPAIFEIYADGIAPETNSYFENSPFYKIGSNIFYGKGLNVRIEEKDDMSGINKTYYSINNEEFKEYNNALQLLGDNEYVLKYYSIDNVGNVEPVKEKKFVVDVSAPLTYYNITGISRQDTASILSNTSIIYLKTSDNLSGIHSTYYKFDDQNYQIYNGKIIPISQLTEGDHTLYYYSDDMLQNKEAEKKFDFYLDKSAPIVATDVLGDRFIVNNKVYFSGRSKLKITAVDNKIGVKNVKYSIDETGFMDYKDPFYLPSKPGMHLVRYYAVDSLDNITVEDKKYEDLVYRHNVSKVYVDLTGPTLSSQFVGEQIFTRDTLFVNMNTKIKMDYFDAESGNQKLAYTIDNNPTEIIYKEPIKITQTGFHKISIIGYDNVNNRNYKDLTFIVDNEAPEITTKYSVHPIGKFEDKDIYPPFVEIYVAPSDNLVGIKQIFYSVNGLPENEYLRKIDGFVKGQKNTVEIRVVDKLSNEAKMELQFYILEK